MIAHMMRPDGTSDITQPPLLAWAVNQVMAIDEDTRWLADCYPALCRFMEWILKNRRRNPAGLLQWKTDPTDPRSPCAESGWDNSPRFDGAPLLDAIDLNAFFSRECKVLSDFAERLQKPHEAAHWLDMHRRWNSSINSRCWNDELGIYLDVEAATGSHRRLRTPAGLLPLVCGAPDRVQARALERALTDPAVFASPAPVSTVAVSDRGLLLNVDDMWRGPVWINVNHQIITGLRAYGLSETADRLTEATLDLIRDWYLELGSIFEFYDSTGTVSPPELSRKGRNDPEQWLHTAIRDYGWSATLALDLLVKHR
jgi:neutral trehalase